MLTLFLITPTHDATQHNECSVRVMSDHLTDITESVRLTLPAPADEQRVNGLRVVSLLTGQHADIAMDERTVAPGRALTVTLGFRGLEWSR